jgi:hypothetical protein
MSSSMLSKPVADFGAGREAGEAAGRAAGAERCGGALRSL